MPRLSMVRRRFADALLRMSESRDLRDVRLADVIDASGMSRQTFYNHFASYEDLFDYVASRPLLEGECALFTPEHVLDCLRRMRAHEAFFRQLPVHEFGVRYHGLLDAWLVRLAVAEFVAPSATAPERQRRGACVTLYVTGTTQVIYGWLVDDMQTDVETLTGAICSMIPGFMHATRAVPHPNGLDYPHVTP